MSNMSGDFDFQRAFKQLASSISELGGFNPQKVKQAGLVDTDALRAGILVALVEGPKTGHDVMQHIQAQLGDKRIDASRVYPLLEELVDTGLVSAKFEKDRRVFKVTAEGKKLASTAQPDTTDDAPAAGNDLNWPKWVDLTGAVPRSLAKLASVSFEVSSSATKAQQEEAAEVLDQARKQLHAILAKG
jgi:DNA-binding PadR family transcriptional regulator